MKGIMILAGLVISSMLISCAARGPATLHTAAAGGDTPKVISLIQSGAPLEARDKAGWTPLMHAAFYGNTDAVRELITRGANVHASDQHGNMAIHHAVGYYCSADIVDLLVSHGAKVNTPNKLGDTPLHNVAMYCSQTGGVDTIHLVNLMLDNGADPKVSNQAGKSAYALAMEYYCTDMVGVLREKGIMETFKGAGAFSEALRKPSFYTPSAGEYVVAADRRARYELAVADCNHMLTGYKTGLLFALGPVGWGASAVMDQVRISRNFDKCMKVMGFDCAKK